MRAITTLAIIIFFLFVITACSDGTLKSTPIVDEEVKDQVNEEPVDDACSAVTCSGDKICKEGSCSCDSGKKSCGDSCIDDNACCADDECRSGEKCESGSCLFDCSNLVCPSGMTCDAKAERCLCPTGYKWCEKQDKCIPQDHCCSRFDCRNDERCTNTITTAEICIQNSGKACKVFNTVGKKTLVLPSGEYNVNLTKITFLDSIDLMINDEKYIISRDQRAPIDDGEVFIQKFRELGGDCRDFD